MTAPFASLSLETRVQILLETDSLASRRNLALTCPSMCEAAPLAARSYIRSRLSDDLVQDAMAIILLPPDDYTDESQAAIAEHLDRWSTKLLPNPLTEEHDHAELVGRLEELVEKVERLMKDYISKATSQYLVHSYLRLPPGSNPSYTNDKFDKADRGGSGLGLSDLTKSERERLFKAFFCHELVCQLQPIVPRTSCASTYVPLSRPYYAPPGFRITRSEVDMLQCVHEYLRTLHGAIAARLARSDGPPVPRLSDAVHVAEDEDYELGVGEPRGRVFPDDVQFDPELGLEGSDATVDVDLFLDCMAGCGLDLATRLLAADRHDAGSFFQQFYDELTIVKPKRVPTCSYLPLQDEFRDSKHLLCQDDDPAAGMWAEHQALFHEARGVGLLEEAFVRMYRQRAWAFFDNDRFHRGVHLSLCSFDFFQRREVSMQDIFGDATIARLIGRGNQPTLYLGGPRSRSPWRWDPRCGLHDYPAVHAMLSGRAHLGDSEAKSRE
ncbi:hypothetical protein ACJ41O_014044 [Fusarium nematophilum]